MTTTTRSSVVPATIRSTSAAASTPSSTTPPASATTSSTTSMPTGGTPATQDRIDLSGLGVTAANFADRVFESAVERRQHAASRSAKTDRLGIIGTIQINGITNANIDVTDFTLAVAGNVHHGATTGNNTLNGTARQRHHQCLGRQRHCQCRCRQRHHHRRPNGRRTDDVSTAKTAMTRSSGTPMRAATHRPMAATSSTAAPKARPATPS